MALHYCGMCIPLSDDNHRFVQIVHPARANSHWKRGRNSNPVATLPHAAAVFHMCSITLHVN